MKANTCLKLIAALFILSLFSCKYKPHGEFEAHIHQPDSAYAEIELSPDDSLLFVCKHTRLEYNLLLENKKLLLAELYVDGQLYKSQHTNPGFIMIDPYEFEPGEYTIELVLYSSTNSGSLADAIGMEAFQYSYSWNAIIETAEPEAVDITEIKVEDGRLKIEWEKNENINFRYYKLYRDWDYDCDASGAVYIRNQDQTTFIDSTYLGGFARYTIYVYVHGHQYGKKNESKVVNYPTPELQLERGENFNMSLTWNHCTFYNNLHKYELTGDTSDDLIYETTDPFDTLFHFKSGIIPSFYRNIYWYSDSASLPSAYLVQEKNFSAGYQIGVSGIYKYYTNTHPPKLFFAFLNDAYKVNSHTLDVESSIHDNLRIIDMDVSYNGLYMVQSCAFEPVVRVFNTDDLNMYIDYEEADLAGYTCGISKVSVSNHGLMLGLLLSDTTLLGYDLNAEEVKFHIDVSVVPEYTHMCISPSGDYFLLWDYTNYSVQLFEVTDTGARLISHLGNNFRYAFFLDNGSEDKVITITKEGEVQIFTCSDQVMVNSFSTEAERILNVDPVTGYLLAVNTATKMYLFYNIESGEKLTDITYDQKGYYWPMLVDSKLYTNGYYYPINL